MNVTLHAEEKPTNVRWRMIAWATMAAHSVSVSGHTRL